MISCNGNSNNCQLKLDQLNKFIRRLLEQYILHGSRPDALEAVITQLSDPKRNHPQKLDDGMVDLLEEVIEVKNKPHAEVVANYFVKS